MEILLFMTVNGNKKCNVNEQVVNLIIDLLVLVASNEFITGIIN